MAIKQLDSRMINPDTVFKATNTQFINTTATNFTLLSSTIPTLSTDTGTPGTLRWDTNYLYFCIQTNIWKRVALSAWN